MLKVILFAFSLGCFIIVQTPEDIAATRGTKAGRHPPTAAAPQKAFDGKVDSVVDGNTLTLASGSGKVLVRLLGASAPSQALNDAARDSLSRLVKGRTVNVVAAPVTQKLGKSELIVGKVLVDGRDVGLEQIRGGFAWLSNDFERHQSPADRQMYREAQQAAKNAKLGVWGDSYKQCKGETAAGGLQQAPSMDTRKMPVGGVAVLDIVVGEDGRVESAKAKCGHPVLQTAAVAHAYGMRFAPTAVAGRAVKVSGFITYNFVVDGAEKQTGAGSP